MINPQGLELPISTTNSIKMFELFRFDCTGQNVKKAVRYFEYFTVETEDLRGLVSVILS